jgi:hypothetical protein
MVIRSMVKNMEVLAIMFRILDDHTKIQKNGEHVGSCKKKLTNKKKGRSLAPAFKFEIIFGYKSFGITGKISD